MKLEISLDLVCKILKSISIPSMTLSGMFSKELEELADIIARSLTVIYKSHHDLSLMYG